jgi:hypothetical protein
MRNKKGELGEGIMMIYRLVLITIIAVVVLGMSAIFYDYHINVRNEEATILTKKVVNCVSPEGVVFLDNIPEENFFSEYCGVNNVDERIFIGVTFIDIGNTGDIVAEFSQGDSGIGWIKSFDLAGRLEKHRYGQSRKSYLVVLIDNGIKKDVLMRVEVLVSHEA